MEQREVEAAIAGRVGAPRDAGPTSTRWRSADERSPSHLADASYGWAYVIVGWTLTGGRPRRVLRVGRDAHPARRSARSAGAGR